MRPSLQFSEWILVGSFLLLLGAFLAVSYLHPHRRAVRFLCVQQESKKIAVTVQGAVKKPGIYEFLEGTRIGEAIKKSSPKRYADLAALDLNQCIYDGQTIVLPELKILSIRVEGEVVSPEELELPIGSRICDLKSKVQCTSHADLSFFKRRRLLKNQEVIVVPKKAVE